MKSKKEIEQLANEEYPICSITSNPHQIIEKYERDAFTKGYTQCQEDIQPLLKDLFSLWESLAKCGEISVGIDFTKHYERLKQQLNKQD